MSEQIWWYLSRSSGIVAVVLLVFSTVWGILLSTRVLKPHDRPAWLLDVHRWLGGLTLTMTGLHLLGLGLDGYIEFGFTELFVPGASPYRPIAITIGILTMYVLVAVQVSSMLRRRLTRRVWKTVHLSSYLVVWGGLIHAGMAGSDVSNRVYQALALAMTVMAGSMTILRIVVPDRTGRLASVTD